MILLKKWITICVLLIAFSNNAISQDFQMTIKAGTLPNAVKATVKPTLPIDGQISSLQATFIVPITVGARPVVSIVTNFVTGLNFTAFESTEVLSDGTYYVWLFDGIGGGSVPIVNYNAGQEYDLLEIKFEGGTTAAAQVRTAQLPNGGIAGNAPGNYNFYMALTGNDVVDQSTPFYGPGSSNDGNGYAGYSYAPINGIALPVSFLNFTATEKNNDALLNWRVDNESSLTEVYEVERSTTVTDFRTIALITPKNNGNTGNEYTHIDKNIQSLGSGLVVYYRIKQRDKDGAITYSSIQKILIGKSAITIQVYPNPTVNNCQLVVVLPVAEKIHYHLFDAAGKLLQNGVYNGIAGLNTYSLPMRHFSAGSYQLVLTAGSMRKNITIVKSK